MEDMGRENPQIYAALDNHQVDHQSTIVEVGGKIAKQSIYVLIDLGSNHMDVSPKVVESCSLGKMKHNKSCLVHLATWIKRKVSDVVIERPIESDKLFKKVDLNSLRLWPYDTLIGMDWMERNRAKVDFYEKVLECVDGEGRPRVVKGIPKQVLVIWI